jgi:hypothetical protein
MSDPIPFAELPELMHSLRSFGSRRRTPNDGPTFLEDQERFFGPLLEARRAAAQAVARPQVVAVFDSRRLTATIDARIREFAAERFGARAPARRALEAELFEIVEPLRDALQELGSLAEPMPMGQNAPMSQEQWAIWLAQLHVVFHVADASWPSLRDALIASPRQVDAPTRRALTSQRGRQR